MGPSQLRQRNRGDLRAAEVKLCGPALYYARSTAGFTLVEALISAVVLALAATAMASLYYGGILAMETQSVQTVLDGYLRSRMEWHISQKLDRIASGSETITVGGKSYTLQWTVSNKDLNGDLVPEPDAKEVTVTVGGRSLSTIIVDNRGKVTKIP